MKIKDNYDVIIIGGGFAGLTLALQLKAKNADISIAVFERKPHPVRESAHKVGESTVEVGAYYLAYVLKLKEHLDKFQLRKLGTRFFFRSAEDQKLDTCLELGANRFFPLPTYQIDRGVFENFLAEECAVKGIEFYDESTVKDFEIKQGEKLHELDVEYNSKSYKCSSRWIIDTSGRAGKFKKKLGITEDSDHSPNSAWFRIKDKISVDDWSTKEEWRQENFGPTERWLSTNHLMGKGYWVWLIPLANGSTSIGIVADPELHKLSEFNTFERALAWFYKNIPECAEQIASRKGLLLDFIAVKHFSHKCKQVFSEDRWAISGDAGIFIDPFYSPGTDFIAYSNTFISDLVHRDLGGEPISQRAHIYNELFFSISDSTFLVYENQYPIFGEPVLMPLKIIWDFAYYWSFLGLLYVNDKLCDLRSYLHIRSNLAELVELNKVMQGFFKNWKNTSEINVTRNFIDLSKIDYLYELQGALTKKLDDDEFYKALNCNVERLKSLALEILNEFNVDLETVSSNGVLGEKASTVLKDVFPIIFSSRLFGLKSAMHQ